MIINYKNSFFIKIMKNINNEIVIIGAGMVGQSIAYQLIERKISNENYYY